MDKSEIVKIFLEKGYFLEPGALDFLFQNPEKINQILVKFQDKKGVVSFGEIISSLKSSYEIEVLKQHLKREKSKSSIQDYYQFYVEKYNQLKEILEKRSELSNLISLSKITRNLKEFSIIATITEINEEESYVIAEDLTGAVKIYFDSSQKIKEISLNDVVGIGCQRVGEKIFAIQIFQPDIPLQHEIGRAKEEINCLFISDLHMESRDFNKKAYENFLEWVESQSYKNLFIFVLGNVSSEKQQVLDFLETLPKNSFRVFVRGENDPAITAGELTVNSPSILRLGEVKLLVCSLSNPTKSNPAEFLLRILKRRYIEFGPMDGFLINPIPDLFVSGGLLEASHSNYKGITTLSTGSFISQPIFWIINLALRQTIKIDFS